MSDLSANERDLLRRIKEKPDLRPLFFNKAKGLKWFDELDREGYFNSENFPDVVPAEEEGYFRIPRWDAIEYLVKTAPELAGCVDKEYPERFVSIITDATEHAKASGLSNYQVWFRFAEIFRNIPVEYLSPSHLDLVDFWLDDQFDRGLVADTLASEWLPDLLKKNDEASSAIALRAIEVLLKVNYVEDEKTESGFRDANLRFDGYHSEKIFSAFSGLSGRILANKAVDLFHDKFIELLGNLGNDSWSSYWQPAVEEHEQNEYHDDAENVLLEAFRESLDGCVESLKESALEYVKSFIESPFQTVRRVAIFIADKHFQYLGSLTNSLLDDEFFQSNLRHELWGFLHHRYTSFSNAEKEKVLAIIGAKEVVDEDGNSMGSASAYQRATWLAAIRHAGSSEQRLYNAATEVAGVEPEHPDFAAFRSSGTVELKSPHSIEELSGKTPEELVHVLNNCPRASTWDEPGRAGLAQSFKEAVKKTPLKYVEALEVFLQVELPYIIPIVQAYSELWSDQSKLPWTDVWGRLFSFTGALIEDEQFWSDESGEQQSDYTKARARVVASIAKLFEAAVKEDSHAIPASYHSLVANQLENLLKHQPSEPFKADSDAVAIAINSARGQCIEALINLALRECRLEDRESDGNHDRAWGRYLPIFQGELELTVKEKYEFAVLLPNYILNFLYMSKEWALDSLPALFSQDDYVRWSCAIQGYVCVNRFIKEVYVYLRDAGDLIRVLNDENLPDLARNRIIELASIAYINEVEDIEGKSSILRVIIERGKHEELTTVIWFFWRLRRQKDEQLSKKVLKVWSLILQTIDIEVAEGKKLASKLCKFSSFVSEIDEFTGGLLDRVAPFAGLDHNAPELLTALAEISDSQPFEANKVWLAMVPSVRYDYPDEAFKRIFVNLSSQGAAGVRAARETVDEYLKRGMDRPRQWLNEIVIGRDDA